MSEIQCWIAESLRSAPPDDQKRLAGPIAVVLMTDHVVALATRKHRIRDLKEQLASARHDAMEELRQALRGELPCPSDSAISPDAIIREKIEGLTGGSGSEEEE